METVLAGLVWKLCYVYLYNILTWENIRRTAGDVAKVLNWLQEAELKLNPSKCNFLLKQVQYLRYTISGQGISSDANKVKAVENFPIPTDSYP